MTYSRGLIMQAYVDPEDQLILELYVRNLQESIMFYRSFGFKIVREEEGFAELGWEESSLYLEEQKSSEIPGYSVGNIRIMVPNVDHYWELAQAQGTRVKRSIGNREYGLRDFTIFGPDGVCLRFGTRISGL